MRKRVVHPPRSHLRLTASDTVLVRSWTMQRLLLPILALLALPGSALLAQNITGTWQGTLKINGTDGSVDLRTVMKISRADNESLKGMFYSIDQDPTPVAMTSITLKGTAVKVSLV